MKIFISILFVVLLVWASISAAEKIRVSVTNYNMSYLAAGVAAKRGFFKEEGLDVEIVRMNANVAMSSLISGDVDYTMIFASVIRAAMRGIPLKVIAVLIDSPPYAFIARPEISAMKTLKGKTVGIGVYGSSNDIIARMMLERSGIDPDKETKLVAFGSDGARFAALKEGLVEAAIIAPPADAQARKFGLNVLARANDLFKFPHIGLGTTNKKLQERNEEVVRVIMESAETGKRPQAWRLHPEPKRWNLHPAARTFQTLRLLVNRELANLEQLLRVLPDVLRPGGRAAIISFHSGEDRLVKAAFRAGLRAGIYARVSPEPVRTSWEEYASNPRARSGKLRWAQRADHDH